MTVTPVFVASTLRNFHQERDLLRGRIARRISEAVAGPGFRIEFVDLRWGAADAQPDREVRESQILSVCTR
jgi:hypothetical protein